MSNFEKLVKEMREAQKAYNEKATGEFLNYMEDLEDEVDEFLNFVENAPNGDMKVIKKYLNTKNTKN